MASKYPIEAAEMPNWVHLRVIEEFLWAIWDAQRAYNAQVHVVVWDFELSATH